MAEEWYDRALEIFGLGGGTIAAVEPGRVALRLGSAHACLWRSALPGSGHELIEAWERRFGERGLMAVRLLAKGGGAYVDLRDATTAALTVWDGRELERPSTPVQVAHMAALLGHVHRLAGEWRLPAPAATGPSWPGICADRSRHMDLFVRLASERLHPTWFDLIYREQARDYLREGEEAAARLAEAWERSTVGVALNRVDRDVFFRGGHGLALKTGLGLAVGVQARDLYRLLARYLPRWEWSREVGAHILAAYGAERNLTREELHLIQAGLRFPGESYRLARDYFLNLKPWPLRRFLGKQEAAWRREQARRRFVEELPSLMS